MIYSFEIFSRLNWTTPVLSIKDIYTDALIATLSQYRELISDNSISTIIEKYTTYIR